MLDNPKIRLSADKSPSTINDDVICSALGLSFFHPKYSYRIGNAVLGYVYVTTYIATKPTKGRLIVSKLWNFLNAKSSVAVIMTFAFPHS